MRSAAERESMGEEVLHLEVGQPSTSAPLGAKRRAIKAIEEQSNCYMSIANTFMENTPETFLNFYLKKYIKKLCKVLNLVIIRR